MSRVLSITYSILYILVYRLYIYSMTFLLHITGYSLHLSTLTAETLCSRALDKINFNPTLNYAADSSSSSCKVKKQLIYCEILGKESLSEKSTGA